ncbi:MAG TPA: phosphatase PAP2 family protein [Saliniramus sp.]|nr:phosphatase PAP2 family protein [Saliniramus sp.]
MSTLDVTLVRWFNGFAQESVTFDRFVTQALMLDSVRLLPLIVCLVWLWFSAQKPTRPRLAVLSGVFGSFFALIVSRLIQNLWIYRPRPLHDEHLNFIPPFGLDPNTLREWSSFPSDNAALAFALAAGVWLGSRTVGLACLVWAFVIVGLPRIYAGYHYPSDIIGGAALGMAATLLCFVLFKNIRLDKTLDMTVSRVPGLFHAAAFVVFFGFATMFSDVRSLARALWSVLG